MRRKLDVMVDKLNAAFHEAVDETVWIHLALRTITSVDVNSGKTVTCRVDGKLLTFHEQNYIWGVYEGFAAAMELVRREANGGG